ncbi:hypothetical protein [Rugamonas rubra]|uniref:Uncharacterized protein n=1 Tax=Rugamonas rubra TaxID=758825 RepID=A0A1I4SHJ3_9BURK|nr:hypothetical protein [Rugamonas rubra]SFM63902.1 hypothetical protein SAMN02982985_04779 [Rugamonas rubra]
MPILGHQISRELLDALGLPRHTASFSLHCRAGQFVTVDCEYYPDDLASMERAFSSYTLERREPPAAPPEHPAVLMGFDAWMRERTERAHAEFMARTSAKKYATGGMVPNVHRLVGEGGGLELNI